MPYPRVRVRLNHITNRFRVIVDGQTVGRCEQVETVYNSQGRPLLIGTDASENDVEVRIPVLEVEL